MNSTARLASELETDFAVRLTPTLTVMHSQLRRDFASVQNPQNWKLGIRKTIWCDEARANYLADVICFFTGSRAVVTLIAPGCYRFTAAGYYSACGA